MKYFSFKKNITINFGFVILLTLFGYNCFSKSIKSVLIKNYTTSLAWSVIVQKDSLKISKISHSPDAALSKEINNAPSGPLTSQTNNIWNDYYYKIPPPSPISAIETFAIIGDFGLSGPNEAAVANLVKSWNPDFIITVGDNNYELGESSTIDANIGQYYHDFIYPYSGSYGAAADSNRFFPCIGNHDLDTENGAPYLQYFTLPGNERYYDFIKRNIHFFVLSSDSREVDGVDSSSIQGLWLKNKLQNSTAKWNVVYFHHPPYTSEKDHRSQIYMQWPFKRWGASTVIAGHSHVYERLSIDDIPYFVNGLGGKSLHPFDQTPLPETIFRYNSDFGAMLCKEYSDTLTFQFYNKTGTLIDSYILTKNQPPLGVIVSSPLNNDTFSFGAPITIDATVTGGTGGIRKIDFFADLIKLGTDSIYPYSFSWSNAQPGNYSLTVLVTDSSNASVSSPSVNISVVNSSEIDLVTAGSNWKYLDNGTDQKTNWQTLTFNDDLWKSGNAEFGYGDFDEATIVSYGPSSSKKYITTYFRKSFFVDDKTKFSSLDLNILRDDGAVVYLNGTEVYRTNMPTGTISYTTKASMAINGTGESTYILKSLNTDALVNNMNIIAVEIHQTPANSPDLSFNLKLSGTISTAASCIAPTGLFANSITSSSAILNWTAVSGASSYEVEYRKSDTTSWTTVSSITNSNSISGLSSATAYEFKVRAICSTLTGLYSVGATFTTLDTSGCMAPTGLFANSITSSTAILNWTAVSGASSYEIEYRKSDTTSWTTVSSITNSYLISGLSSSTAYEFKVHAICSTLTGVYSAVVTFATLASSNSNLILDNSSWKYLDNGTNQGTAWSSLSFNDGAWETGNAELGYGDGDEATVVSYGTLSTKKHITTYFRKTFNVADKNSFTGLELSILRDDGAVVYLNGTEVFRTNMPAGIIYYNTLASSFTDGAAESAYLVSTINMAPLLTGNNVMAVEIHQSSKTSSDISFNLKLRGLSGEARGAANSETTLNFNLNSVDAPDMIIYPNPNTGTFTLEFCFDNVKEETMKIEIFNPLGQSIYQKQAQKTNGCIREIIELSRELAGGVYILKIASGNTLKSSRLRLMK